MYTLVTKKQPDKDLIEEVALVMALSPAYVEKDWYITQIINLFENLNINDYTLVFTGGTALSKAHKLIKRVSEDLDFRIIADKRFHSRTSLSNLKNFIRHC
jgi:predicted nucleotidyltransferase component of viral defense system